MTMKPILSQRSKSSGAGGLCEQRMPLHPISFKISNCRSMARVLTAAPKHPRSWCIHTPLIFVGSPLSVNPLAASNEKVRKPNVVS